MQTIFLVLIRASKKGLVLVKHWRSESAENVWTKCINAANGKLISIPTVKLRVLLIQSLTL